MHIMHVFKEDLEPRDYQPTWHVPDARDMKCDMGYHFDDEACRHHRHHHHHYHPRHHHRRRHHHHHLPRLLHLLRFPSKDFAELLLQFLLQRCPPRLYQPEFDRLMKTYYRLKLAQHLQSQMHSQSASFECCLNIRPSPRCQASPGPVQLL